MAKTTLAKPLTAEWKAQIAAMFDQKHSPADLDNIYRKLFRHYYFGRYNAPTFHRPDESAESREWNEVYNYLSEMLRQGHERLIGRKPKDNRSHDLHLSEIGL